MVIRFVILILWQQQQQFRNEQTLNYANNYFDSLFIVNEFILRNKTIDPNFNQLSLAGVQEIEFRTIFI